MPFLISMPKLSPTMTEGSIAKWYQSPNTYIKAGELLFEIATDKATIEHHALEEGWLREILVKENQTVNVGTPLAIFSEEETEDISSYQPHVIEQKEEIVTHIETTPAVRTTTEKKHIAASPLAKKLAKKHTIDLSTIQGSGPKGRIMSRDLPLHKEPSLSHTMTPMRLAIAKKLQHAKATIPHFYLRIAVDASSLTTIHKNLKETGYHITINDLIIKATAIALMDHPEIRASFIAEKEQILHHPSADIAVAVSVPGGLITPIIFAAETKTVAKISAEIRTLAKKAKEKKLQPHEYSGGAFTITNLGMFGIDEFYPIINAPQIAILGIGTVQTIPAIKDGNLIPSQRLYLTLAIDHRVLDGVEAAMFLQTLKTSLEQAAGLLL